MSAGRGHEMRKFLVTTSLLVILLIAAVILYTILEGVNRVDREMETEKDRVVLSLVDFFNASLEEISVAGSNPRLMEELFNPALAKSSDIVDQIKLLQYITEIQRAQYTADYMTYVSGGMLLAASVKPGLDISDFPTEMVDGGYEIVAELGGREGTFISVFHETEISPLTKDEFINVAIDRTEEFDAIEGFFAAEKTRLIKRQIVAGVVAAAISLLITVLGVYLLTRRYITGPIEKLADASHRIMDGTFDEEVEVVEDSDYADIQRLLQSGKVLMEKMGEVGED